MKMRNVITALISTLAVTAAFAAHAQEISVTQTRPSQSLLSSGVFTFSASYIPSVVVAAESSHPGDHELYVPLAGPWMDVGDRHCPVGQRCQHEGLYEGLLIAGGIFQALGAFDTASAFLLPETVIVTGKTAKAEPAKLRVAPMAGGSAYGLAAVGSF